MDSLLAQLGTGNEVWPTLIAMIGILVGVWSIYHAYMFNIPQRWYILVKGMLALWVGIVYFLLATDDLTPLITRGLVRPTIVLMLLSYAVDTVMRKW